MTKYRLLAYYVYTVGISKGATPKSVLVSYILLSRFRDILVIMKVMDHCDRSTYNLWHSDE